ncbi:NTF2-like domain containing protein [Senna tora]|uniref:NTF2-like domain containing protein n=1 Tax=Senna tora TaxID=362788 RepID=A0A834SCU5_9FABA|nr:NTF2-like domain containing protein [Senna tora]
MALLIHSPEMPFGPKIFCNPSPNFGKLQCFQPFTSRKIVGSKGGVKVSCRVKDSEVSNLDQKVTVSSYGQFSAPVKRGSRPSKEEEEKQNYYVNMGYAIRTLREEFPELFFRELSFDIYRDDIVFKDPLNTFMGLENYKSIFWALRFHGRIFFKALWVDIISVWQPVDNIIMVRWTVHGIPRVPWESRGRFDGTSEYKLDKKGKIFEHRVENIALNSPPKFKVLEPTSLAKNLAISAAWSKEASARGENKCDQQSQVEDEFHNASQSQWREGQPSPWQKQHSSSGMAQKMPRFPNAPRIIISWAFYDSANRYAKSLKFIVRGASSRVYRPPAGTFALKKNSRSIKKIAEKCTKIKSEHHQPHQRIRTIGRRSDFHAISEGKLE